MISKRSGAGEMGNFPSTPGPLRVTSSEGCWEKRIYLASIFPTTGKAWNMLGGCPIGSGMHALHAEVTEGNCKMGLRVLV